MPLVSVIIPSYNYAHYLPNAIRSVLKQMTDGIEAEIIVVDDGSTDNTAEIALGFGAAVRYFHQENRGLPTARNTGMRNAKGDYLIFLDADDLLGPDAIASQLANFKTHPELDISMCVCVTGDPAYQHMFFWPARSSHHDLHLCYSNISPVHTFMIRSGLAAKVGYFNPELKSCEDHEYWLRCAGAGSIFGANPNTFVYYTQHSNSMTSRTTQQVIDNRSVCNSIANLLENRLNFPRAGKYYGWLAFASGKMASADGVGRLSLPLAEETVDEAALAMLKAAHIAPKTASDDRQLIIAEHYFITQYLAKVMAYGNAHSKNIRKSIAFIAKRCPNLVSRSLERLNAQAKELKRKLMCDMSSLVPALEQFKKEQLIGDSPAEIHEK